MGFFVCFGFKLKHFVNKQTKDGCFVKVWQELDRNRRPLRATCLCSFGFYSLKMEVPFVLYAP